MVSAPIELSSYNPEWPTRFKAEKSVLAKIISPWLWGSIEHVGSTAVPGLIAKPVIDIMVGIKSLEHAKPAIDVLVDYGYQYFPYKKEVMHWFCKPSDEFRTHHLHLVPYKSQLWQERIRFRDLLRANQTIANDYAALKQSLATRYQYDREAYTQAKGPFIRRVLVLA